jgi:hypothetical protein
MAEITLEELVNDAFFLTSQWDITRLPDSADVSRGINILNNYIIPATPNADIAFRSKFSFNLTPGKESYTFGVESAPGIDFVSERIHRISFAFLTLNPPNATTIVLNVLDPSGYEYYMSARVINQRGMPLNVLLENTQGVSTVTFYLPPDQNYEATLVYTKDLSQFGRQEPISNVPAYQLQFFRYELAYQLCQAYNLTWDSSHENSRQLAITNMQQQNFRDLTVRTSDVRRGHSTYRRIYSGQ